MGLSRFAKMALSVLSAIAIFGQCYASNGVVLQNEPWPTEQVCMPCVRVQFGKLEMRLPVAEIGKLLVIGAGDSNLHVLPNDAGAREGMTFLSIPPDKFLGRYREAGLLKGLNIATNEQLLDVLGQLPSGNKSLAKMRQIEGIEASKRYTKSIKGSVRVYWVQSSLGRGSQRAYFVIDGEDVVYSVAGDISPAFFKAVLSNLTIVNVP